MQTLANLLSVSCTFVVLFSAYSKPLFIDLSMQIIHYFNTDCNVHMCRVMCPKGSPIVFYCSARCSDVYKT